MRTLCESVSPNLSFRFRAGHEIWTQNAEIKLRQKVFAEFGEYYVKERKRNGGAKIIGTFSAFSEYLKLLNKTKPSLLKSWPNKNAASCALKCKIGAKEQIKWDNTSFNWTWGKLRAGPK